MLQNRVYPLYFHPLFTIQLQHEKIKSIKHRRMMMNKIHNYLFRAKEHDNEILKNSKQIH